MKITFTEDDSIDPYPIFVDILNAAFKFAAEHKDNFGQGPESTLVEGVGEVAKGLLYDNDEEGGDTISIALNQFRSPE